MKRKHLIGRCKYPWGDFSPTHAINHYLGCAFNCSYCWSRDVWWKRMGGHLSKAWGVPEDFEWQKAQAFDINFASLWQEMRALPSNARVLLCSTTDAYQPIEADVPITRAILDALSTAGIPTMILTKAALLPERDFDILKSMDAWFGVTMDGRPTDLPWRYARATTLWQAHEEGIKTFVSLEPWIPGVDAQAIVKEMYADHWIIGRLNYKGVGHEFYQENLPALIALLERMGASYYIKPDLRKCLEGEE